MSDDEVNNPRALAGILARAAARRRVEAGLPPDREPIADLCKPLSAKVMPRSASLTVYGRFKGDQEALQEQRKEREGHGDPTKRRRYVRPPSHQIKPKKD